MIRFLDPIGVGTFGEVWRGDLGVMPLAALKISFQSIDKDDVRRETYLYHRLVHLTHPCIVRIRSMFQYENRLCIAMELADCDLFGKLRQYQSYSLSFPEDKLHGHMYDVAAALDYCHSQGVIHAGVNPGDILLFDETAKIADFGMSHRLDAHGIVTGASSMVKEYCMAPELRKGRALSQSDQYALAATFVWLRRGSLTYIQSNSTIDLSAFPESQQEVLQKALATNPAQRFGNCTEFVSALVQACT